MCHQIEFCLLFLAILIPNLKLGFIKLSGDWPDVSTKVFVDHVLIVFKSVHYSRNVFGVSRRFGL